MPVTVIVGAQWGDEAKGKIVDALASQARYVVRFSGGNNAGHTVVVGEQEFKFHLLPVGILHPEVTSVLGCGMVICPQSLVEELEKTRSLTQQMGQLKISAAAHVVFDYHRTQDRFEEDARGAGKIGTTSRGIGPAYQDKVARSGIRMGEFVQPERFRQRFAKVHAAKAHLMRLFGQEAPGFEESYESYAALAKRLKEYVKDTEGLLQEAAGRGEPILLEGAQGTFLDLDHGTYPYVTSSHPTAAGACLGSGLGPRQIDAVLGVAKAYTTRVGEGPFPTELTDAIGEQIRSQGREFGTTTGRPRRCGWLDLVLLRQSCLLNSMTGLILTRLDVLSGLEKLKVCVGYRLRDEPLSRLPQSAEDALVLEPQYEEFEGWQEEISGARSLEDLPQAARRYLDFIEEFIHTPIVILSIGPERTQTLYLKPERIWNTPLPDSSGGGQ